MKQTLLQLLALVRNNAFFLLAGAATLLPLVAGAAAGDLDPLNPNVLGGVVNAAAVQPDGKTILAGSFTNVLGAPRNRIARLNADGTLDASFDPKANNSVACVAVQADGKVLLGGDFTTLQPNGGAVTNRSRIARVNADGTLDASFDPKVNGSVYSLAVQADGKILLVGFFTTLQPNGGAVTNRQYLARVNADGTLDASFDPNVNNGVTSVAVQADGKVLLSGNFTTLQPNGGAITNRQYLARVNADGTLDPGFDPKPNSPGYCMAVQADGKLLLGGNFTTLQPNGGAVTNRQYLARVNGDGTLDTGFDPKANNTVYSLAVQADGKVLLGGAFTTLQPNGGAVTNRSRIARVNADGTLDFGFDPKADNSVFSVAAQMDGKVLLGGSFTTLQPNGAVSATPRSSFARLLNDPATQALSAPSATQVSWTRGGSAPEVSQVAFELSTNSGVNWTLLGSGTRVGVTPNWQLTGIELPGSGQLRAGGRSVGGYQNGSSGRLEFVASFSGLSVPEIAVRGNGVNIADGDSTPSTADFTDFGSVPTTGGTVVRTFTITNSGTANLTLSSVTVGGANAADFTVNAQPAAVVAPSGSTTFQVTFNPASGGLRSAALSCTNNDFDENPFNFSIQGTRLGPEIAVSGNGVNIADGDSTPSPVDHTDFGSVNTVGGTLTRTFTITNSGVAALTLGNVSVSGVNAADFTVNLQPSSPVAVSNSTTFQVTFDPSATGLRSAALSFTNNDANENPFNFSVQGTGFTSSNADLSALVLSAGTLVPGFAAATTNYAASVPYGDSSTVATPTAAEIHSTLQIRVNAGSYASVTSGSPSGPLALNVGTNTLEVRVTAQNGTTTKTYVVTVTRAAPAAGDVDSLIANVAGSVSAAAVQPDGKIILAGTFTNVLGVVRYNLARLNADGTLDIGFDPQPDGTVGSLVVQPDGKIVIGGAFSTLQPNGGALLSRRFLVRLNAEGTLDASFDPKPNDTVSCLAVQPDGKLLLGGYFTTLQPNGAAAPTPRQYLARVNADGTLDSGFDPKPNSLVLTVAAQTDGKVLLGGTFTELTPNGALFPTLRQRLARVNAEGTLDYGFDPKPDNWVVAIAVQADGKVLLGGNFSGFQPNGGASVFRRNFARVNADGTLDTGFDPSPDATVLTVAVQADGKVLLGGGFANLFPNGGPLTNRSRVARVNPDGTLDPGFDPEANGEVDSVALQADGKVLLGGQFTALQPNGAVASFPRTAFARLYNDPAPQTLSAPDGTQVSWTRGGSAPELFRVTFEWSTNSGVNWTLLGTGTRVGVTPNWQLSGLNITGSGQLRARGRPLGSEAGGLVESVASFSGLTVPEVAVRGNGVDIADGDATPSTADFTDFGSVPAAGGTLVRTFTITNSGAGSLALGSVIVGGVQAADFTVNLQPTASVAPSGSTTFQVTFNPGASGLRSATLSFNNNDYDENPFTFSIQGTRLGPEITVSGNGATIADGDSTPNAGDHTDFGIVTTGATVIRTFTITNSGADSLTLGSVTVSGAHAADFTVNVQPVSLVAVGGSTTFQVAFAPSAIGLRSAALSFTNNDVGETPFNFSIQGTGVVPEIAVSGNGVNIADGDSTPSLADGTDFGSAGTAGGMVVRTFSITNSGTGDLILGSVSVGGVNAADFTVNVPPVSPVAGSNRTTFQVTFDPSASGLRSATLSFSNNDSNENPFNFSIQGTGILSSNADLSALVLSAGTLVPGFASATTNYYANVPYGDSSTVATPTAADTSSTLQLRLNGGPFASITSGSPSAPLALNVGTNTLEVRVTAQDGTTIKTYAVAVTRVAPAAGDVDSLIANVAGSVSTTAVQPDGKIILAGTFTSVLGVVRHNLARLNADGTLDTSFDPQPDGTVGSFVVQPDGKIVIGGAFTTLRPNGGTLLSRRFLVRLNADGTLDTSFDPKPNDTISCLAVQPDGKLLLGGYFTTLQPNGATSATNRQYLARVNADGTLDTGFYPKPGSLVLTVAMQADGKVLLGGLFTTLNPNNGVVPILREYFARVNADGTLDNSFYPKPNNWVVAVAVQADGKVLLGGNFNGLQPNGGASVFRRNFARVNTDGTLDTGFDPSPDAPALTVAVQADGKVLLGGGFANLFPNGGPLTNRSRIARVNSDGTLDPGFDPKANNEVDSVALQADGKVLLGGQFSVLQPNGAVASFARAAFARLYNDPAPQTLNAPGGNQVSWTRGGSAPEVSQVTFDWSTNNGVSWSLLGTGTRVGATPNWQLTGLNLPSSGQLRARGRPLGTRAGSLVESVAVIGPEIAVRGNGVDIADGNSTPGDADDTDFGSVAVSGGTIIRTFAITNSGNTNLTLGSVIVGGAHAADFTVNLQPGSPVGANGSASFQVTFNPSTTGLRSATLSFTNNDSDENPFNFSIQGTGIAPEIAVAGNGVSIADGDSTPSAADQTDFGSIAAAGGTVVHTFTITNSGSDNLALGSVTVGGTHAADFTVTAQPAALVGTNGSTTFQITFDPSAIGLRSATLSFTDDDSNENPFNFSIQGTGMNTPPTVANSIPDQGATQGIPFSFTFATNTFADVDAGNVFTYTASGVPAWLTFTPATRTFAGTPGDANVGFVDITVTATDNGTPTNASVGDTFRLTVTNVNDVPVFTKGPNRTNTFGTTAAQNFPAWATGISDGDLTVTQALTFNTSVTSGGSIFATPPAIASNGTLTYTPNGTSGVASVNVSLTDDATAGGPALTSAAQTFTITVGAPPPPPVINVDSLIVLSSGAFQFTFANTNNFAFNVLAATNVSQSASNWSLLGLATNLGGGLYQFTDPTATNSPRRYYRLRFP